jgi:hypothetical protein
MLIFRALTYRAPFAEIPLAGSTARLPNGHKIDLPRSV